MKFVITIPTTADDTDDEEEYAYVASIKREDILYALRNAGPVEVTLDDRPEPDPMDLVKEIGPWEGHNGPRTMYVWFTNGHSACSCHSEFAANSTSPSLR